VLAWPHYKAIRSFPAWKYPGHGMNAAFHGVCMKSL
jgi:hypothetical protein